MPLALLLTYLALMFVVARLLDLLVWYRQGDMVDPFVLSVRQLKQLLEVRGVSYTGYYEKKELALLVESSGNINLVFSYFRVRFQIFTLFSNIHLILRRKLS